MSFKKGLLGVLSGAAVFVGGAIKDRQANPQAPPVTAGNVLPAIAVGAVVHLLNKKINADKPDKPDEQ